MNWLELVGLGALGLVLILIACVVAAYFYFEPLDEDRRLGAPSSCEVEGCENYGMIFLEGREILCWDHYVQRMKEIRDATSDRDTRPNSSPDGKW